MTVNLEHRGENIALITLNRPQSLNAINGEMRRDLTAAMANVSANDAVRAVVITGEGRGFCAGADIGDGMEGTIEDILNTEYGAFLSIIETCEKPVIAAVNGPCAGIGMTLALACDLRVMSSAAYMMMAFSNIGLVPDGGLSWLITREIGYARAFQLAVEAEKISAQRCLDLGLVNRVVAPEETLSNALDWAGSLIQRAPIAIALTKRTFRAAAQDGLRNAAAFEAMLQRTAVKTEDCREGVTALMAKRKPQFKGR
ncbi:MAG TPA: enoyl-CoA hydratase-related protein [Parvularculaceae bacterium]|nr:enoyl-CoA hydratase-related protein [Parvularculaceae bacterium]